MKKSILATACLVALSASQLSADELQPVKSVDEMFEFFEFGPNDTRQTTVFDNATLRCDIPDFGKFGMKAQLKIVATAGPGRRYLIVNSTWTANGKTVDGFHEVWGPDGLGTMRSWTFRSDGVTSEGRLYRQGEGIVNKVKCSQIATDEEAVKRFGKEPIDWTLDFAMSRTEDGRMKTHIRNILVNGNIKLPDFEPKIGRVVDE